MFSEAFIIAKLWQRKRFITITSGGSHAKLYKPLSGLIIWEDKSIKKVYNNVGHATSGRCRRSQTVSSLFSISKAGSLGVTLIWRGRFGRLKGKAMGYYVGLVLALQGNQFPSGLWLSLLFPCFHGTYNTISKQNKTVSVYAPF